MVSSIFLLYLHPRLVLVFLDFIMVLKVNLWLIILYFPQKIIVVKVYFILVFEEFLEYFEFHFIFLEYLLIFYLFIFIWYIPNQFPIITLFIVVPKFLILYFLIDFIQVILLNLFSVIFIIKLFYLRNFWKLF